MKQGFIEVSNAPSGSTIPEDYVLRIDFDNSVSDKSRNNLLTEPINFSYTSDRSGVANSAGAFSTTSKSNVKIPIVVL